MGARPGDLQAATSHGYEIAAGAMSVAILGDVALGVVAREGAELNGPMLCPFRLATGLPCPFCGMTRSLFSLGQGRVDASFDLSPVGPLLPLVAVLAVGWILVARGRVGPPRLSRLALTAGAVLLTLSWTYQLSKGVT
jgi:Protein of unknown function (DUF2752)